MREKFLPLNWEQWMLADVGQWLGGGTPSKSHEEFWSGSIPWVSPKDMKALSITDAEDHISEEAVAKSAAKIIPDRSVLFVTRSGILAHSFPVATTKAQVTVNQDLKAIVPEAVIDPEYLGWCLRAHARDILNDCTKDGTTVHSIEMPSLKLFRVPIAPLKEQRRVVAKIEELFSELDKGVESLTTAREQLKVYRQTVLKHAFEGKLTAHWREENKGKLEPPEQLLTRIKNEREARYRQEVEQRKTAVQAREAEGKPGKNPAKPRKHQPVELPDISLPVLPGGWTWGCLGHLNVDIFDGPFGSNLKTSDYVSEGVRVIRLENIGVLEFIEDKHSYVTEEKYETIKRHTVRAGDIVFSSFVADGIRVSILPDYIDRAVNKADCFCVRMHGETVSNDYVTSLLSTRLSYKQVESEIHGIGRPRINTTQLKGLFIPICSPEEQRQLILNLSEKLSLADHIDSTIEQQLGRCEVLRQAILKKAFSGQLVAQDPNNEPASVLLERIRAEKAGQANGKKNNKRRDAA